MYQLICYYFYSAVVVKVYMYSNYFKSSFVSRVLFSNSNKVLKVFITFTVRVRGVISKSIRMTREASQLAETKIVQVGNYRFTGKILGKGSFAVVKEAVHVQLKVKVSVKTIDLKKCNNYMLKNLMREATILQTLDHPYTMRLFETIKHADVYYMVTEVMRGGDLCAYVQQHRGKVEENTTRRFSRQIGIALRYLHGKGIVHRDLKLENVMLDYTKENIKLIDFGLSNNWAPDAPLKTLCGSPEYSAPELFVPGTQYGPEVDLWALGVIMFAMAAGRLPFPCVSSIMKEPEKKSQFMKTINSGLSEGQIKLIKDYSLEFTRLIKGLMNPNWEERLSIDDVFNNIWMTNKGHWVDVQYETLDAYDMQRILNIVSNRLGLPAERLKTELSLRPYGEAGGFYNIMAYEEIRTRNNRESSVRSTASNIPANNLNVKSSPKKRSSPQSLKKDSPKKISLVGSPMKLNEVIRTKTPIRGSVNTSTTSSSNRTESTDKKGCYGIKMARGEWLSLPKIGPFKSPCSESPPFRPTTPRSTATTANKSVQTGTKFKKKSIPQQTILPSKIKLNFPANRLNMNQQSSW